MRKIIVAGSLFLLLATAACVVAPGPAGYYPGPYVAHPAVYGGGYYYHHGYGYYR